MIDAPHPNHSSESALLVGSAKRACKLDDCSTIVPFIIRIFAALANFVTNDRQHIMYTRQRFIVLNAAALELTKA
jgi:hypothetical protein